MKHLFIAAALVALATPVHAQPTREVAYNSRSVVRIDAKLAKRWHPSPWFWWGTYLEVLNATHGTQVVRRVCNPSGCRDEGTGPITLPSLGLEAGWR